MTLLLSAKAKYSTYWSRLSLWKNNNNNTSPIV